MAETLAEMIIVSEAKPASRRGSPRREPHGPVIKAAYAALTALAGFSGTAASEATIQIAMVLVTVLALVVTVVYWRRRH